MCIVLLYDQGIVDFRIIAKCSLKVCLLFMQYTKNQDIISIRDGLVVVCFQSQTLKIN